MLHQIPNAHHAAAAAMSFPFHSYTLRIWSTKQIVICDHAHYRLNLNQVALVYAYRRVCGHSRKFISIQYMPTSTSLAFWYLSRCKSNQCHPWSLFKTKLFSQLLHRNTELCTTGLLVSCILMSILITSIRDACPSCFAEYRDTKALSYKVLSFDKHFT